MNAVFHEAKQHLRWLDVLEEYWWRAKVGRMHYIAAAIIMLWTVTLILHLVGLNDVTPQWAEGWSKVLAPIGTVWGLIVSFNRSLLWGSAEAAKTYAELASDSRNEIKKRFTRLIDKLRPNRVAVIIDDLDRCQSSYVITVLEGIQTLFRDASVVFVVAADRYWLNACYEEVYDKLRLRIAQPGKPLGTLFLEKAFRFSAPMPGIPPELRSAYWNYLLRPIPQTASQEMTAARQRAKEEVQRAESEEQVRDLVNSSRKRGFVEGRAMREEAAVRIAAPAVLDRIEHMLKPYGEFLEPNPRGMKLLVNSYSANRALAILSEIDVDLGQLAWWTILCARWPLLADYLVEHPSLVSTIGQPPPAEVPQEVRKLLLDEAVYNILLEIHEETIRMCSQIR